MVSTVVGAYSSFPWSTVVEINSFFSDGTEAIGTGVLVGPSTVLTASHVVYQAKLGLITSAQVFFNGVAQGTGSGASITVGSDTRNTSGAVTSLLYNSGVDPTGSGTASAGDGVAGSKAGSELDLAILQLDSPIGLAAGWLDINTQFTAGTAMVAGYPALYGTQLVMDQGAIQKSAVDNIFDISALDIHSGNSGGPILVQTAAGLQVVGLVSTTKSAVALAGWQDWLGSAVPSDDKTYTLTGQSGTQGYVVHGGSGDNYLSSINVVSDSGAVLTNALYGDAGDDYLDLRHGQATADGGAGNDTAIFFGARHDYDISGSGADGVTVYNRAQGAYVLTNIEALAFSDVTLGKAAALAEPVLFDRDYYLAHNADVYGAMDPGYHYQQFGWKEGRDPNAVFDSDAYTYAYGDVRRANTDPLAHYDLYGWKEGRDPSVGFDTHLYLVFNPDVAASGMDPLLHYLNYGQAEGRKTYTVVDSAHITQDFDATYYKLANVDVAASGMDALAHYLSSGWQEGRDPNAYFDTSYYLAHNQDVAAAGLNPLQHYFAYGWKEGRDPSARFDGAAYLAHYADVVAAGVEPLQHFLQFGLAEGRASFGEIA